MGKNREIKMMFIMALVLAVTAMTLGFAAFSTTLNISSSANVTPSSDDFHMTIYGLSDISCLDLNANNQLLCINDSTLSVPLEFGASLSNAVIDNSSGTISNIRASFENFNYYSTIYESFYYFKLVNDGKYDIYLKQDDLVSLGEGTIGKRCVPIGDTTKELVDVACENMVFRAMLFNVENNKLMSANTTMISPGEFMVAQLIFDYRTTGQQADGPFEIIFDDIKIKYSTVQE